MKKILQLILITNWIKQVLQVTRITNLKTPSIDFSNGQVGYLTLTTIWTVNINHDSKIMEDLLLRAVFPFAISSPVKIKWTKVADTCEKIRDKTETSGTTISGDETGSQVFLMKEANFTKSAVYYMEFHISTPPGTVGADTFYDPMHLSIISTTKSTNFITYAYNPAFSNFYISPDASTNIVIDTSPTTSSSIPKSVLITKTFSALIDLTINTDGAERILLKLDNHDFAHDAAETCEVINEPGYKYYSASEYECALEGDQSKGVYFSLKTGSITNGDKMRLQLKIKNPSIPGNTALIVAILPRYSGYIIEYKTHSSAFSCSAIDYATGYPQLYVGPNLLVSSSNYPGLGLYSSGDSSETITFNSIKVLIKPKYDIPEPSDYYQLELTIGGGVNTIIPHNLVYENFNKASSKTSLEITVDPTAKIIIKNIGALSSLSTYGVGFKIGLSGSEGFAWTATGFLSVTLKDSSGLVIISQASPVNIPASFKTIHTQNQPSNGDMPTLFHTLPSTASNADFAAISSTNYGLRKSSELYWFVRGNFVKGGAAVNTQTAIEIITNMKIVSKSNLDFIEANIGNNCFNKDNTGADISGSITACRYDYMNKGQDGEEYSRFRMIGKTNSFWSPNTGTNYFWGFKKMKISVQNSLYLNDQDAVILDTYINLYNDVGGSDPTVAFPATATSTYMDNMIVINPDVLNEIKIDFPNYYRHGSNVLDGSQVPTFLRLSGILNGINTVQIQKILLFYNDFEPLFLDNTDQSEIGCSNSDQFLVRCYKQDGLNNGQATCNGGTTCKHRLYRNRIEIHFTTDTISTANAENIQVLIPIKLLAGAHANFDIALGVASTHSGAYGDFNQLIEYKELSTISRPSSASGSTLATLTQSSGNTNAASSIKPKVVSIDTAVKGMMGEKYTSKIDFDCDSTSNNDCKITAAGEYYSITLCAEYNFMAGGDLSISNSNQAFSTFEVYKKCVQDIKYQVTTKNKYCLWCAIWASGTPEDSRAIYNFVIPDYYDNKWPTGTYGGFSGRNTLYGLVSLTNLDLITDISFTPNKIKNVNVSPTTWYKSYESMKLKLDFQTTNRILNGGSVIITCNTNLPVTFAKSPNTYCYIMAHGSTYTCSAQISTNDIVVTLSNEIKAGAMTLELYGLKIAAVIAEDQTTYRIQTSSDQGTTSEYFIDISDAESFVIQHEDHPSGLINRFSVEQVTYGIKDQGALSTLNISVVLGNSKFLYMNDKFIVNLGDGAYLTTTQPVWCYPVNAKGEILTKIRECNADDLAALTISSDIDTELTLFNIVLENYILRTYTGAPATDLQAELKVDDGTAGYATAQTLFSLATNILPSLPDPAVDSFSLTVTKDFNLKGLKPITKLSFSAGITVTYKHTLHLVFSRDIHPQQGDNVHSCVIDDSGYKEIFCVMKERRKLIISGFPRDYSGTTVIKIEISGLDQGRIVGNEMHFAALYNENNEFLKSGFSSIAPPGSLTGKNLLIYDLAFSNLYIRDENSLSYKFKPDSTVSSSSKIHIFLDYFTDEYIILDLNMQCSVKAGGSEISSSCRRIGKRVIVSLSTSISANQEVEVKIDKLVTPNYKTCSMKNIMQYIESGGTIQYISHAEYMNVKLQNAIIDSSVIYLNFEGLSSSEFITVRRGTYNSLKIMREDGKRFNDEMTFKLSRDYNGQFKTLNPLDITIRDSYLGEASIPVQFGCLKNSLLTVFLLKMNKTERFKLGRFSPLPFLVIETNEEKQRLPVPTKIEVYRGYESLPMILKLEEIPIEDLKLTVKIESFDSDNKLSLSSESSITMNKNNLIEEIIVKSTHEITSDPISNTNSRIVLTPEEGSPYETTYVELEVVDLVVDTSIQFSLELVSISAYTCSINLKIHMPLTIYYYIVPRILYQDLNQTFVEQQLKKGIFSDSYITYGILNVEKSLEDFSICGEDLMADMDYIIRIHYKTFVVQQALITKTTETGTETTTTTTTSTETSTNTTTEKNETENYIRNSSLAVENVTLLWDPLYRPKVGENVTNETTASTIKRLDQGSIWFHIKSEVNNARQGYIELTFEQGLTVTQRKNICCYFGQTLSYSIESIWTSEGERCSSQQIKDNINYIQGELPKEETTTTTTTGTGGTTRLLGRINEDTATEEIGSNQVTINILRNLRQSQDSLAYASLTTIIYLDSFTTNMVSQYSLPPLNQISPLQESTSGTAEIDTFANWTIQDDRTSVLLNRIKLKNTGYVYSIILEKSENLDDLVSYQHIKLGVNPVNTTVKPVANYSKYYETINEEYSYTVTNLTIDKTYVLYYYGTTNSPNQLPGFTPVYKLEFIIKGVFRVVSGVFKWCVLGWVSGLFVLVLGN